MSYESWGTFHIITLFCPIVLVLLLYFSLKNKSLKFQKIIIFSLSLIGIKKSSLDKYGCRIGRKPYICRVNKFEAVDINTEDDLLLAEYIGKIYWKY